MEGAGVIHRLPPVDPDYLLVEDDPEALNAYARGLWERLRYLNSHPREKGKKNSYNIETVKAATVWLVGRFVDAKAPIPYELYRLIDALVEPKPDVRTGPPVHEENLRAYWSAIEFESRFPPDPRGRKPSSASRRTVAEHIQHLIVKEGRATAYDKAFENLKNWRDHQYYKDNVSFQRNPAAHLLTMRDRKGEKAE